jgi:hypothetical protein
MTEARNIPTIVKDVDIKKGWMGKPKLNATGAVRTWAIRSNSHF